MFSMFFHLQFKWMKKTFNPLFRVPFWNQQNVGDGLSQTDFWHRWWMVSLRRDATSTHTNPQEVCKSIAIQFKGAPGGWIVAHLFYDGTTKTAVEIKGSIPSTCVRQPCHQAHRSAMGQKTAWGRFPSSLGNAGLILQHDQRSQGWSEH